MPGCLGKSQAKFVSQRATNRDSLLSEHREGAACTTELHDQGLVKCMVETFVTAADRTAPTRSLEPKSRRRRGLQKRSTKHHGAMMFRGQTMQRFLQARDVRVQDGLSTL